MPDSSQKFRQAYIIAILVRVGNNHEVAHFITHQTVISQYLLIGIGLYVHLDIDLHFSEPLCESVVVDGVAQQIEIIIDLGIRPGIFGWLIVIFEVYVINHRVLLAVHFGGGIVIERHFDLGAAVVIQGTARVGVAVGVGIEVDEFGHVEYPCVPAIGRGGGKIDIFPHGRSGGNRGLCQ